MIQPRKIHAKFEEKKKPHLLPVYLFVVSLLWLVALIANGGHV